MERIEQIRRLNTMLLSDMPQYRSQAQKFSQDAASQRCLLRSLMNVRPPLPLKREFLAIQDALLSDEMKNKGVVDASTLATTALYPQIAIWQGDITRLKVDAVVNAANSSLLGCFHPCHACIDNAIHSAAGLQLRDECNRIMQLQGHPEPNGRAKLTKGYHLPARYILHTVGPMIQDRVTCRDQEELASCYCSCLELAAKYQLESVAFCCISTGEFHFPHQRAAEIAVKTVADFLRRDTSIKKVIFNVFQDVDANIYRHILEEDGTTKAGA